VLWPKPPISPACARPGCRRSEVHVPSCGSLSPQTKVLDLKERVRFRGCGREVGRWFRSSGAGRPGEPASSAGRRQAVEATKEHRRRDAGGICECRGCRSLRSGGSAGDGARQRARRAVSGLAPRRKTLACGKGNFPLRPADVSALGWAKPGSVPLDVVRKRRGVRRAPLFFAEPKAPCSRRKNHRRPVMDRAGSSRE
jgi:hypothetical protein